ncbi:MAG: ABC transporter permease [Butyrivibrio sp.]|nr:ABC transporter permease [Butyrivibrio sp.]
MKKILERIYLGIILLFMYAPIVTLIVLSFNLSKSRARWGGFTLNWYIRLFSDRAVASALMNTLSIAVLATIFSTIIGTITCIAMIGLSPRLRSVITGVTNIPMINADIVTGISLMLLFRFLHIGSGFMTILLAHITFDIPFVMLSVMPRIKNMNFYVYEAALDLGATPFYAFRKTILPDLMPGVISGALMAFTMSLDDFIITYFTKGSGFETLSTLIYNEVKRGIQPEIYALSAIIFVVVLTLLLINSGASDNIIKEKK